MSKKKEDTRPRNVRGNPVGTSARQRQAALRVSHAEQELAALDEEAGSVTYVDDEDDAEDD